MSKLPETAFMIARLRALDPNLSRDPWAHLWASLWTTKTAQRFEQEMISRHVPGDPVATCLRNRFFLEALLSFEKVHGMCTFLNIGAGLTSYPYFLSSNSTAMEIDLPEITEFKRKKIKEFENESKIPERNIEFISLDLNEITSQKKLIEVITRHANRGPFFVLIEGLLFCLQPKTVDHLFKLLGVELPKKSEVACSAFSSEVRHSQGIEGIREFHESEFETDFDKFVWLGESYFQNLKGFSFLEATNYTELEKKYCKKQKGFNPDNCVFETFYRLGIY